MADDGEALDSWEELEDTDVLDKKLEGIKVSSKPEKEKSGNQHLSLQEEGNRTQYQPQVRILKRQTDSKQGNQGNSAKGNKPTKTLQQREAEYREARERILGSDYKTEESTTVTSPVLAENRPIKLVQNTGDCATKKNKPVKVLREPKGPDGTGGFDQQR